MPTAKPKKGMGKLFGSNPNSGGSKPKKPKAKRMSMTVLHAPTEDAAVWGDMEEIFQKARSEESDEDTSKGANVRV